MSEDFDREAEREKLRKQLEREEETRAATQRMSDLLLKGATMTNRHCGECGDPIFRYQGQAFCPTCERPVAETGTEEAPEGGADVAAERDRDGPAEPASAPDVGDTATEIDVETPGPDDGDAGSPPDRSGSTPSGPSPAEVQQGGSGDGDVGEARAALVRTLTALTREAEATDDVRRARELLSAAREAAETLAALDAAGR